MTLLHIMNGLEACTATGEEASAQARLGFLEWAFCGGNTTPQAARAALASGAAGPARSAAARAFLVYLHQAAQPLPSPRRRSRRLLN